MPNDAGFIPSENPCCGPHAIAIATGLPFHTVYASAAALLGKRASWRGRMSVSDLERVLEGLGAPPRERPDFAGRCLLEAAWQGPGAYLGDAETLLVWIPGHYLVIRGGRCIDQHSNQPAHVYGPRFASIKQAWAIPQLIEEGGDDLL